MIYCHASLPAQAAMVWANFKKQSVIFPTAAF
jgi:hypothetical protein